MLLQKSPDNFFCPQQVQSLGDFLSNSAIEEKCGPTENMTFRRIGQNAYTIKIIIRNREIEEACEVKVRLCDVLKSIIRKLHWMNTLQD